MTAILGISAFYHDSAAALLIDGEIVAAAQEERFTRIKHDFNFPVEAIAYCLQEAGLEPEDLDYVGFCDKPFLKFERIDDEEELCRRIAELIVDEKVVGLMQGRMEFGPRALGCRSIIGDARSTKMQSVMNLKIKFRESFRPFAPIVLRERVAEYFEMRDEEDSPYMLLVAPVRKDKRIDGGGDGFEGLDKLKTVRSEVPAITHVDSSARVQTVDKERHGRLYHIMKAFEALTDCPVLINTSFNVRGEPIVCSPQHAYRCFMGTNMDVLVLENYILLKTEQPSAAEVTNEDYLAQFKLD